MQGMTEDEFMILQNEIQNEKVKKIEKNILGKIKLRLDGEDKGLHCRKN